MGTKNKILSTLAVVIAFAANTAMAGQNIAVRASALNNDLFQKLRSGEVDEVTIEFRQGDKLPITFRAEGDLIESTDNTPSYVAVKRGFFVKMTQSSYLMSFDGADYQPIDKLVKGSLSMGAQAGDQDHVANGLSVVFQALLK